MSKSQWTIGADPTADIWVDHPDVSGFHCRLARTASGYTLEDLDSTNGTFCDGRRIEFSKVSPSQQVRLAGRVPIPWPDRRFAKRVISIGYDSRNRYRILDDSVSSRHAELLIDPNGQIVLCDLESTNGTWVGRHRICVVALKRCDTFRIGLVTVTAKHVLSQAAATAPNFGPRSVGPALAVSSATATEPQSESDVPLSSMVALACIPVLVGITCIFLVFRSVSRSAKTRRPAAIVRIETSHGHAPRPTRRAEATSAVTVLATTSADAEASAEPMSDDAFDRTSLAQVGQFRQLTSVVDSDVDPFGQALETELETGAHHAPLSESRRLQQHPSTLTGLQRVRHATFLLVAEIRGKKVDFATAWAAKPNLLVTNAQVIDSINNNHYSVSAIHLASGTEVSITRTGYHPDYRNQRQRRRIRALDVAWIELASAPPAVATLDLKAVPLQESRPLRLASASIARQDPVFWDAADPREVDFVRVSAVKPVLQAAKNATASWTCRLSSGASAEYVFDGCPVVDLRGRLVGMYRRPARTVAASSDDSETSRQANESFDMITVSAIHEMVSSLPTRKVQ